MRKKILAGILAGVVFLLLAMWYSNSKNPNESFGGALIVCAIILIITDEE